MDQRPYPVGVFPQMSLKPEDIMRAAFSLVDEFGEQAETVAQGSPPACRLSDQPQTGMGTGSVPAPAEENRRSLRQSRLA